MWLSITDSLRRKWRAPGPNDGLTSDGPDGGSSGLICRTVNSPSYPFITGRESRGSERSSGCFSGMGHRALQHALVKVALLKKRVKVDEIESQGTFSKSFEWWSGCVTLEKRHHRVTACCSPR